MMIDRHGRSKRPVWLAAAVVVLVGSLALAASAFAGGAATPMQQAQAALVASKPPTSIFATVKSTKPLPKGSNIQVSYVHCGQPGCTDVANGLAAAIKGLGLGWKFTVIPTDGSPTSIQSGWTTATRNGSKVIFASGFPDTMFAQQLTAANKAGVPVFNGYILDTPKAGYYPFGGASDVTVIGKDMAAWATVKSGGKANVLFVDLPAFPILAPVSASFKKWMPVFCPGCPVGSISLALTDLGKDAPQKIVSYIRAHPGVNYVALVYDGVGIGVPAALKLAGLDKKVKMIGESPSAVNLGYVAAGGEEMTVTQGYSEAMASAVDAAARLLSGQKVDPNELKLAYWVFKKGDPKNVAGSGSPVISNLYAQYLALWPK